MQQKLVKSAKLQDRHFTASDLGRVMVDPNEAVVANSPRNEVTVPTKSRNRRKMDLQKTLAGKEPKSSESGVEEHPDRHPFSNRTYSVKVIFSL